MINKQKYHRLKKEYQETGNVTVSAMRADVNRPTARKYLNENKTPPRPDYLRVLPFAQQVVEIILNLLGGKSIRSAPIMFRQLGHVRDIRALRHGGITSHTESLNELLTKFGHRTKPSFQSHQPHPHFELAFPAPRSGLVQTPIINVEVCGERFRHKTRSGGKNIQIH
jgi:hypothetical protein